MPFFAFNFPSPRFLFYSWHPHKANSVSMFALMCSKGVIPTLVRWVLVLGNIFLGAGVI